MKGRVFGSGRSWFRAFYFQVNDDRLLTAANDDALAGFVAGAR